MSGRSKTRSVGKSPKTLTDDAIVTTPKMKRRGLLALVSHGMVGAAAMATGLLSTPSQALTDGDTGRNFDQTGQGRGSGVTDSDTGRNADPVSGGGTGLTDSDTGRSADTPGNGRRPHRQRRSDAADTDRGRYADPADAD